MLTVLCLYSSIKQKVQYFLCSYVFVWSVSTEQLCSEVYWEERPIRDILTHTHCLDKCTEEQLLEILTFQWWSIGSILGLFMVDVCCVCDSQDRQSLNYVGGINEHIHSIN